MANKIEQSLSLDDLRALLEELAAQSAAPTLRQIQEAAARRGVRISLMGASSFREKNFEGYLAELRRKKEAATVIAEATGAGATAADAAAALGSDLILDQLLDGQLEGEALDRAMLTISRLRAGNQASAKLRADLAALEQKLVMQRFDAAKAVVEHADKIKLVIADRSLDAEARTQRVAGILWGARPADFRPVTDKGEKSDG